MTASAERLEQVVALLVSRDEGLPEQAARPAASRGFSHDVEVVVDCADCLERRGDGLPTFGCETCGGTGQVRSRRDRDPYALDKVQPYGLTPDRHEVRRAREAELARLGEQLREPWLSPEDELADANRHPYGWERERARRYAKWDYGPLDRALEALRDADVAAYHVLHSVYVYGYAELSVTVEALVMRGLVFVAGRMPDPIRAPGWYSSTPRRVVERRGHAA